jgi:hypothetical protein
MKKSEISLKNRGMLIKIVQIKLRNGQKTGYNLKNVLFL